MALEKKSVSVFGATGSVGRSTLDLISSQPECFDVQVLTSHSNAALLAEQACRLEAKVAVIADPALYEDLRSKLSGTGIEIAAGREALLEAAAQPVDWTMAAIVGMAGLEPLVKTIEQGGVVAIANKEPLVAAGPFVKAKAAAHGATLLPVDSEHNAVFQVFEERNRDKIEQIILTASGGPFRTWSREKMAKATPQEAVAHPNWSMGAKISVDSATMMNKALEVIEAHFLFDMPADQIAVRIHPQSIIHSLVCYTDGSVLAQMGAPDMKTPIAHTLAWPERMATTGKKMNFLSDLSMDIHLPDEEKFPALPLAYECLKSGLAACVVFNAANEIAVQAFLGGKIGFLQIVNVVKEMLENVEETDLPDIAHIIGYDQATRKKTLTYIDSVAGSESEKDAA